VFYDYGGKDTLFFPKINHADKIILFFFSHFDFIPYLCNRLDGTTLGAALVP